MFIVGKRLITVFVFLAISIAVSSAETACDRKPVVNPGGANNFVAGNFSSGKSPDMTTDKWLEGTWTGQQGTNKVNLTIKPGRENATLKYIGPRGCALDARDSGTDTENRQLYVFTSSNGGWCDDLSNGILYLKKNGNNLSYTVTNSSNKQIEAGSLKK